MNVTFLHAATGKGHRENARPVIATIGCVDFGCATEFGADHDKRLFEHAAIREIGDEAGKGLVKIRSLTIKGALDVAVVIPAAVVDGNHAHAGFDQTTGQQETLTSCVATIFVAEFVGLLIQIKGFAGLRAADEAIGGLIEAIHGRDGVGLLDRAEVLIHGAQKTAATVKAFFVDVLWREQVTDGESFVSRVAAESERTEGAAHVACALFRGDHVWHNHVGWQIVSGSLFMGDHGAEAWEFDGRAWAVAGEHVMRATLMGGFTMGHAADHRQLVHDFGDVLELLAHIFSRNGGFNWRVRTTVVRAGEGLRIPGLMLSHAAGQVDVNDGVGDWLEGLDLRHD